MLSFSRARLGAAQIVPDPQRGLAPRGSDVRGTCCPQEIRPGGDFLWYRANDCRERPRADEVGTLIVYAPEPCADSVFPSPSAPRRCARRGSTRDASNDICGRQWLVSRILSARAKQHTVRFYDDAVLVKAYPRAPVGGRATDAIDFAAERNLPV